LAEVLITLGIIGVVAALTMPALVANHQKNVVGTRLRKFYATLQHVYHARLAADSGLDC
jgi:type II secretory pathway pseudopilin PulG